MPADVQHRQISASVLSCKGDHMIARTKVSHEHRMARRGNASFPSAGAKLSYFDPGPGAAREWNDNAHRQPPNASAASIVANSGRIPRAWIR